MCKGLYKNSCINRANIPISDAHRLANTQSKCNTYYSNSEFKVLTLNWQWNYPGFFYNCKMDNIIKKIKTYI